MSRHVDPVDARLRKVPRRISVLPRIPVGWLIPVGLLAVIGGWAVMPTHVVAADAVVVCPRQFRTALQPWLEHRRDEGLTLTVIDSQATAAGLQQAIRQCADDSTRYVVLVGDAPSMGAPCDEASQVPIHYAPTKVTRQWGSTPTLSSDLPYGDFDQDHLPDAVVGRLPVDRPDQLTMLVDRIIARDACRDFGNWRGNVQLVGGVGGFGALVDKTIESVTRTILTNVLPAETRTSVIYASPGHPFFPREQSFTEAVLDRYRTGSRFWVYAGHGWVTELDRVPNRRDGVPVLDCDSAKHLQCAAGTSPIGLMLACYTGAIDAAEDSIAEEMVLADGGPIAVVAGSRVTMPYGNTTAAVGLVNGVFVKRSPRLGDAWLSALCEMHQAEVDDQSAARVMIDALAAVVSPAGTDLVQERREHMLLYNLIGDPTVRLHHPQLLSMQIAPGHRHGEKILLDLETPIDGLLKVCIDRPLGAVTPGEPDSSDANDLTVCSLELPVTAGRATLPAIELPPNVTGPLIIRAIVAGEEAWATAAVKTIIR